MSDNDNVQELNLNDLRENKTEVAIFLANGIKLTGTITDFDKHVVMLDKQMVYKHAISTVVPVAELPRKVNR